ncbi:MAG: GNAT family N-acetyltransferase [Devosia sp.]
MMVVTDWTGRTIIETERLLLRGFRRSDLPHFAQMHTDAEVMEFLGARPLEPAITDGIAAAAQRAFDRDGNGKIAVERKSDGAFLGMAGLSIEDEWYPDDVEVGWRLARPYWGHGYATEAAAAWLNHAFEVRRVPRVISVADVPNHRSIAVMQRLGLTFDHTADLPYEGSTFPAVIYAITAENWRNRSARS